jgi:hypothetical protein
LFLLQRLLLWLLLLFQLLRIHKSHQCPNLGLFTVRKLRTKEFSESVPALASTAPRLSVGPLGHRTLLY